MNTSKQMNDPFVVAWRPAEIGARSQACNASNRPIFFWTDYESQAKIYGDDKIKGHWRPGLTIAGLLYSKWGIRNFR